MKTEAYKGYKKAIDTLINWLDVVGVEEELVFEEERESIKFRFDAYKEAEKNLLEEIEANALAGPVEGYVSNIVEYIEREVQVRPENIGPRSHWRFTLRFDDPASSFNQSRFADLPPLTTDEVLAIIYDQVHKFKYQRLLSFLRPVSAAMPEPADEVTTLVEDHIKCFSGKKNGYQLLSSTEYEYLLNLTVELVRTKQAPENIKPLPKNSLLPIKFILRTYYNMHQVAEGRNINNEWLKFIGTVFQNYTTMDIDGMRKAFSRYDGGIYEHDKNLITNY